MNRKYISRNEAAEMLGVHPQTISNYAQEGLIFVRKTRDGKGHPTIRVAVEDVEKIAEQMEDLVGIETRIARYRERLKREEDQLDRKEMELKEQIDDISNDYKHLQQVTVESMIALFWKYIPDVGSADDMAVLKEVMRYGVRVASYHLRMTTRDVVRCCNAVRDEIRMQPDIQKYRDRNHQLEVENKSLRKWMEEHQMEAKEAIEQDKGRTALLETKLIDLDISVRTLNCMKMAEIETLGDLVSFNKADLLKFRNFGKKTLTELENLLAGHGLEFYN